MTMSTDQFEVSSVIRGHHVYKHNWSPFNGEELTCLREEDSDKDRYAVAVTKSGSGVVGHVPRRISAACALFLQKGGSICCTVTGARKYSTDLPQGGLEVPCYLTFKGDCKLIAKLKKLLEKQATKVDNEVIHQSKKRKLDTNTDEITESPCSIEMWVILNNFKLSSTDKNVILAGNELTDMHINFCQAILKKQFPKLAGLHSTLLLHRCTVDKPYALQILHCRGNHWCVVTSIGCPSGQVMVYDSL